MRSYTVVFVCGGTGGHIVPALSLASCWRKRCPSSSIYFLGREGEREEEWVSREGYIFRAVSAMPWRRHRPNPIGKTGATLISGVREACVHMENLAPHLVIGTGGYVSLPVYLAAAWKRIPLAIHEQNSLPGRTNVIGSFFADWIFLGMSSALDKFPRSRSWVFGNPIRPGLDASDRESARRKLGLHPDKKVLLVFGGSQGARVINTTVLRALPLLAEEIQLLWVTGEDEHQSVIDEAGSLLEGHVVLPFIWNMHDAYAAADIAISRAGAMTVSELETVGIYSIFVPLPTAAENHQYFNAMELVRAGRAQVIEQRRFDPGTLVEVVRDLPGSAWKRCPRRDFHTAAAERIVDFLFSETGVEIR